MMSTSDSVPPSMNGRIANPLIDADTFNNGFGNLNKPLIRMVSYRDLENQVERLTHENSDLRGDIDQLRIDNTRLISLNSDCTEEISRLKTQIVAQEQDLVTLMKRIKHTETEVTRKRKQRNDLEQARKKQCTELNSVKAQKDQLEEELAQLKKTKLFSMLATFDDLNKRSDTISNQILKSVSKRNKENYTTKFQVLKHENDQIIGNLTTVNFQARCYQSQHEELLKLQEEIDGKCMDTMGKIHKVTNACRKLMDRLPDNFLKIIADLTRNMDALEKVNFDTEFDKEADYQENILGSLSQEREIIERILKLENPNYSHVRNETANNLENGNNLSSSDVLVVHNMEEGYNELDDVIKFHEFVHQATGRKILISGVERYGIAGKEPRPARITLKSPQDLDDVLNSKIVHDTYKHVQVSRDVVTKNE